MLLCPYRAVFLSHVFINADCWSYVPPSFSFYLDSQVFLVRLLFAFISQVQTLSSEVCQLLQEKVGVSSQ